MTRSVQCKTMDVSGANVWWVMRHEQGQARQLRNQEKQEATATAKRRLDGEHAGSDLAEPDGVVDGEEPQAAKKRAISAWNVFYNEETVGKYGAEKPSPSDVSTRYKALAPETHASLHEKAIQANDAVAERNSVHATKLRKGRKTRRRSKQLYPSRRRSELRKCKLLHRCLSGRRP